jgi:hypothetical protein
MFSRLGSGVFRNSSIGLCTCMLLATAAVAEADPRAREIAEKTMTAMGGAEAFAAARLLRFDFTPVREGRVTSTFSHWWDRHTGAYRLEGRNKEGIPYRVLFDVDNRTGRAWLGDRELAGEELARYLEMGYGRFINDSYWLLMPWKWLDPGVILRHEGQRTIDGRDFEVLALSFGSGVGLTSNDRYWAYVATDTWRMERWAYLLQTAEGAPGEGEPTEWAWEDWQRTAAGIELATVKRRLGEGPEVQITFPVLEMEAVVSEARLRAVFAPSEPLPAPAPPGAGGRRP